MKTNQILENRAIIRTENHPTTTKPESHHFESILTVSCDLSDPTLNVITPAAFFVEGVILPTPPVETRRPSQEPTTSVASGVQLPLYNGMTSRKTGKNCCDVYEW